MNDTLVLSSRWHHEESVALPASVSQVFDFVDDPFHFSSHMSQSSWMMAGGRMAIEVDAGRGRTIGSHIRLKGKVFGAALFLDEVITVHDPPYRKTWETVGTPRLIVIGTYRLGFELSPEGDGARLRVFIDYDLPTGFTRVLGYLFGRMYATWCVRQMSQRALEHFRPKGLLARASLT